MRRSVRDKETGRSSVEIVRVGSVERVAVVGEDVYLCRHVQQTGWDVSGHLKLPFVTCRRPEDNAMALWDFSRGVNK